DKGGNEVVAVVVAGMAAQNQRLLRQGASRFKGLGIELLLQEAVGQALVNQYPLGKWALRLLHQQRGIVARPGLSVVAQVGRKCLLSPWAARRRGHRRKSRHRPEFVAV